MILPMVAVTAEIPDIEFGNNLPASECCRLAHRDTHCTTYYPDGTESSNWPLLGDSHYASIAGSLGFGDTPAELMRYCWEHEFCHSFVPMALFGRASYVVWNSAHGLPGRMVAARMEEYTVYLFQRCLHDLIAPPATEWPDLVTAARGMLGYTCTPRLDLCIGVKHS